MDAVTPYPLALSLEAADLIAAFIESLLYGIYSVLFGLCIWTLRNKPHASTFLTTSAIVTYVLCTFHLAIDLWQIGRGTTITIEHGAAYRANSFSSTRIASTTLYLVITILADFVVIWRCFVIWGNKYWVCVGPMVMLGGTTASGISVVYYLFCGVITKTVFWGKIANAMTLATNIVTTILIFARITLNKRTLAEFTIDTGERSRDTQYYHSVMSFIIDTGLIYSALLLVDLLLFILIDPTVCGITFVVCTQISGMVPTLIVVYGAFGTTHLTHVDPVHPLGSPANTKQATVPFLHTRNRTNSPALDVNHTSTRRHQARDIDSYSNSNSGEGIELAKLGGSNGDNKDSGLDL